MAADDEIAFQTVQKEETNWQPGLMLVGKPRRWMDVEVQQEVEHIHQSPIMLDEDNGAPTQTEYDRTATSTVPKLPTVRRHRRATENVMNLLLCKETGEEIQIPSGNCNLSVVHFLDQEAAGLYLCCMCSKVAFDPRYSYSCKHLYCRTCILNLQEVSGACWLYMQPGVKCSQGTKEGPLRPLPYKENFLYKSLRASCPKCFKVFTYYKDMAKHLACRGNHARITKNSQSTTGALEDLHGRLNRLSEVQGVSPSLLCYSLLEMSWIAMQR